MNYIDLLLIIVILFSVLSGFRNGFISGSIHLIKWLGSLIATFFLYKYTNAFLLKLFPGLGVYSLPAAFILTLIVTGILLGLIFNPLYRSLAPVRRTEADRALGTIPGFVNGLVSALVLSALLLSLPISDAITNETRASKVVDKLSPVIESMEDALSPVFDEAVTQALNKLTVEPGSEETVKLRFTDLHPIVRPDLEERMLELVNAERIKNGLSPLDPDPELTEVARKHSEDMLARGYFSHYTPEGKTPFDRMKASHVRFRTAGENLALAPTLIIAHKGLMNSPGHRANILNANFGRCGIGILDAGMHGLMISQEFRN